MSKRTDKVESVVHHEVATALAEFLPRQSLVTVTGVEVSPDLKQATIWVGIIGENEAEVMSQINEVRREVQHSLNRRMTTKFVPRLTFQLDKGGEYAEHISKVLKQL